jgi:hypothetical protein
MLEAQENFLGAANKEEAISYGKKMWRLQAEYLPVINSCSWSKTPIIISNKFGNVLEDTVGEIHFSRSSVQWFVKE